MSEEKICRAIGIPRKIIRIDFDNLILPTTVSYIALPGEIYLRLYDDLDMAAILNKISKLSLKEFVENLIASIHVWDDECLADCLIAIVKDIYQKQPILSVTDIIAHTNIDCNDTDYPARDTQICPYAVKNGKIWKPKIFE